MSDIITLVKVRLSYPHLFQRATFNNVEGKYSATLLIEKGSKNADIITKAVKALNKNLKASKNNLCLKDGDEVDSPGYEGHLALRASNNKRPTVIDRDRSPLTEDDDVIYPGCYVVAKIGLWAQDNKYGKRINCNLHGVQFHSDGDSFTSDRVTADDFEDLDEF